MTGHSINPCTVPCKLANMYMPAQKQNMKDEWVHGTGNEAADSAVSKGPHVDTWFESNPTSNTGGCTEGGSKWQSDKPLYRRHECGHLKQRALKLTGLLSEPLVKTEAPNPWDPSVRDSVESRGAFERPRVSGGHRMAY